MKKLSFIFLLFVGFLLSFASGVSAASFGISPADLTLDYLSPGMVVEKDYLISRSDANGDEDVVVEPEVDGINDWIKVEPSVAFTIPKGQKTKHMKVVISVPKDAQYKKYQGYLNIKVGGVGKTSGVSIVEGVSVAVDLTVTKEKITNLSIKKIEIPIVLEGNLIRLFITAQNQGNQRARLDKVGLSVKDKLGIEIFKSENTNIGNIDAGREQQLVSDFTNTLTSGEYTADISVTFDSQEIKKDTMVFRVEKNKGPELSGLDRLLNSKNLKILSGVVIFSLILITSVWRVFRKKIYQ